MVFWISTKTFTGQGISLAVKMRLVLWLGTGSQTSNEFKNCSPAISSAPTNSHSLCKFWSSLYPVWTHYNCRSRLLVSTSLLSTTQWEYLLLVFSLSARQAGEEKKTKKLLNFQCQKNHRNEQSKFLVFFFLSFSSLFCVCLDVSKNSPLVLTQ